MKKILKALAAVVVVAAGANVSAEPISGEISFSAVAGWLETGGVVIALTGTIAPVLAILDVTR